MKTLHKVPIRDNGKLGKEINNFVNKHHEMDTWWFGELLEKIVDDIEKKTEKRVYKELNKSGWIIAEKNGKG